MSSSVLRFCPLGQKRSTKSPETARTISASCDFVDRFTCRVAISNAPLLAFHQYRVRQVTNYVAFRSNDQFVIRGDVLAFDGHFFPTRQLNRQVIEEAFGVDGRHTAGARRRYRLAID